MSTTLTIRTDKTLRTALERRARAQGRTVSELAREILRNGLEERPLELKTGHPERTAQLAAEGYGRLEEGAARAKLALVKT